MHVTYITGPDIAGHWGWECADSGCREEASGYDHPDDVVAAAEQHGPLAADSLVPTYDDDED